MVCGDAMFKHRRFIWRDIAGRIKRAAPRNFASTITGTILDNIDYVVLAAISAWFGATIARDSNFGAWQIGLGAAAVVAFGAVPAWAAHAIQKHHRESRYVFPPSSKYDFIWIGKNYIDNHDTMASVIDPNHRYNYKHLARDYPRGNFFDQDAEH